TSWALRHLELFPVELMTADYEELLRIPGIGPKAACKILQMRKNGRLEFSSLKKLHIPTQKTSCFITIKGKTSLDELYGSKYSIEGRKLENPEMLREMLREKKQPPSPVQQEFDFLS
ncbi:MAG TPA: helix-hairpin-helix domain-containing protein, partial [Rectinema sp.]|nr:helix-hairpin-helix domain-containing protein [Rectinema sp.]